MEITLQSGPQWRKMTAKFAGRCCVCGKSINAGEIIHWSSGYGAKHETCQYSHEARRAAYVARTGNDSIRRQLARQAADEWADARGER